MQICTRCGGVLQTYTPRKIVAGHEGIFHLYCGWKLEQQLKEKIDADKIHQERGFNPSVHSK